MNYFDMGGQKLRVGKAIFPPGTEIPVLPVANNSYRPARSSATIAADRAVAAAKLQAAAAAAAITAKIQASTATADRAAAATKLRAAAEGGAGAWKSYYTLQTKDTASDSTTTATNNRGTSSAGASEPLATCDPERGCTSEEMDEECPECPSYAIFASEALKCGPDGGPRLLAASVDNEKQQLDMVKTFPIPGTFFRLNAQLLPVKKRTFEMTVALLPTDEGINVAKGDILGRCQKVSGAWANEVRKFHRKFRSEVVLDDAEETKLVPGQRVKKRVRLVEPDKKGFEPLDQVVVTSFSGDRMTVCRPGLIKQPNVPFELTLENTSRKVLFLDRKRPIGSARHINSFG